MSGGVLPQSPSEGGFFRDLGLDAAAWRHLAPFLLWLVLMSLLGRVGLAAAWAYAWRSVLCLVLFLWLRPWRHYEALRVGNVPAACLVGVGVMLIWVLPEASFFGDPSGLREVYLRFGVLPLGELPGAPGRSGYAPAVCGWGLTLMRLGGSAFVIAILEEFFWRGFLYRRFMRRDFLAADPGDFDWEAFLLMVGLFAIEHDRWLAGAVAGAAYGILYLRTRDLWAACVAHVVTNFLLGVYVIIYGAYGFW